MSREAHVRFWERAGVRLPRATRCPLYRQGEFFARLGADMPKSTLIDWCGQAAGAVRPVAKLIRAEVMAADRLHADDTGWVYVRDDRPLRGLLAASPSEIGSRAFWPLMGEHPQTHLKNFIGILQAPAGVS